MATIDLTDTSSASVSATLLDDSVLGKTPSSVLHFLRSDVIGALGQALDKVQIGSVALGFDYEPSIPLDGGTATFTAGGGPTGELDLFKPAAGGASSPLFPKDQFGADIEMGANYYLALSFQLGLTAGDDATPGAFTFKPSASASGNAKLYLPFGKDAAGNYPTLQKALTTLLSSFHLPSSEDDLRKLPAGAVFTYDAQGSVGFQAQLNFLTAINPTATPGISSTAGPISVTAGPSVTIAGGFTLTGEIETRIWKKSDTVLQIGYYKKQGSSFTVSFNANIGADVTVGGYDVLAEVYSLLGDSGKLDPAQLAKDVPASIADDVKAAYQAAVQTKLSIAIDEECDTSITDQAAFSWNFDLSALDAAGQGVLAGVFKGDLTALLGGGALPAGITKAGSVLDHTNEVKHTFSFNFLGLFDYAHVTDAVKKFSAKVSDDGQLVLTDTAHLTRLAATATPFIKSDQLRKVFAEDCVATIGYSASLGTVVPTLKVAYNYYSYKRKAHHADLELFVDTAVQLREAQAAGDWAGTLQSNSNSQAASLFISLNYDGASSRNLFLDSGANPRSAADYHEVGRNALLSTPGLGLSPQFIACLKEPAIWQKLLDAGSDQPFYRILGVPLGNPPAWAQISFTWTLHVVFWSSAMHSAGQALQGVLQYLAQNPGPNSLQAPEFQKRRKAFAGQLLTAIKKTPLFDDALGLMTVFEAATPLSKAVTITYAGTAKNYQ